MNGIYAGLTRVPARVTQMKQADVVGIDEAQFYPDLIEVCESLADMGVVRPESMQQTPPAALEDLRLRKRGDAVGGSVMGARVQVVILSALDGTFQREPFGSVLTLMPRAERITKLSAVCKLCCKEASFTRRTTADTALEAIGGAEMYMPTCRRCFTAPLTAS